MHINISYIVVISDLTNIDTICTDMNRQDIRENLKSKKVCYVFMFMNKNVSARDKQRI